MGGWVGGWETYSHDGGGAADDELESVWGERDPPEFDFVEGWWGGWVGRWVGGLGG